MVIFLSQGELMEHIGGYIDPLLLLRRGGLPTRIYLVRQPALRPLPFRDALPNIRRLPSVQASAERNAHREAEGPPQANPPGLQVTGALREHDRQGGASARSCRNRESRC